LNDSNPANMQTSFTYVQTNAINGDGPKDVSEHGSKWFLKLARR
jgi:hypothetical protein